MKRKILHSTLFTYLMKANNSQIISKVDESLYIIKRKNMYYLSDENFKIIEALSLNDTDIIDNVIHEKLAYMPNHIKITYSISNRQRKTNYRTNLELTRFIIVNLLTNQVTFNSTQFIDFEKTEYKTNKKETFFFCFNYKILKNNEVQIQKVYQQGLKELVDTRYLQDCFF